jgi:hypothetical protein
MGYRNKRNKYRFTERDKEAYNTVLSVVIMIIYKHGRKIKDDPEVTRVGNRITCDRSMNHLINRSRKTMEVIKNG